MIPWNAVISFDYACDQCEAVRIAHDEASFQAEYGVNWHEFIHTTPEVYGMVDKWWETVPEHKKQKHLQKAIEDCQFRLDYLKSL